MWVFSWGLRSWELRRVFSSRLKFKKFCPRSYVLYLTSFFRLWVLGFEFSVVRYRFWVEGWGVESWGGFSVLDWNLKNFVLGLTSYVLRHFFGCGFSVVGCGFSVLGCPLSVFSWGFWSWNWEIFVLGLMSRGYKVRRLWVYKFSIL